MLSKPDRQRLAEIESKLIEDDPQLAELFRSLSDTRQLFGFRRFLALSSILMVAMLSVLCLLGGLLGSAVGLAAAAATGAALLRVASKPSGKGKGG